MDRLFKCIEAVLAALLLGMVLMVFGNVLLRYAFNSGIQVSEELSRFFFIWLTFIGAIIAMREGAHLGMDNFVSKLSRRGKLISLALCQGMILLCCAMLFRGTWVQHEINATTSAPVTGLSMIWVFGVAYLTAAAIGVMALRTLWRIATGRIADHELIAISESEEAVPDAHAPAAGTSGARP
ncbi:TRAP transporter small permease [Pseudorhodoferax sp.]|uniref:TRAP transporter small permease n=1 Tax=Pseudorhodoferax sp. TaxID=1993553 RepID=UPI002DD65E02|nr:TRAP transporter small permease [Pseudorhodoferax sp.]